MDFETFNTDDLLRDIGLLSPKDQKSNPIALSETLNLDTLPSTNSKGAELLIVSIDIGNGSKDNIIVHENDNISLLVKNFSTKHNLTQETEAGLIAQIKSNLYTKETETKQQISRKDYAKQWSEELDKRLFRPPSNHPSICEQSRKIMQKKIVPNVYERLHNDSLKNKIKQISSQENTVKTRPESTERSGRSIERSGRNNSCERLYNQGMLSKQKAANQREKIKLQREEELNKALTFHPEINKLSKSIVRDYKKPEDSFYLHEKHKHEFIEKAKGEKLSREQEFCTFNPELNQMTEKILRKRYKPLSRNKFSELYEEAKEREWRQQEIARSFYEAEFPFQPSVKLNSQRTDPNELIDRLVNSRKEIEEHIRKERVKRNELCDPSTGQEFFRPITGRAPSTRHKELPIWDHLYSQSKSNRDSEFQSNFQSQREFNPKSDEIYSKLKYDRYLYIFQNLKPDLNGEISAETIKMHTVDPAIYKVISPLMEELEMVEVTLDFDEFFDSLENLMKALTPEERNVVLSRGKRENSARNTPQKSRSSSVKTIHKFYERSLEFKQKVDRKLEEERKRKELEELNGCTFHPRIIPYKSEFENEESYENFQENFPAISYCYV
ncbi:unnamed protein product [Blepharisma stoltei]|uniref:Uncharacterized protein n=1 Tax=Blepharisma stoltei TaxID=1481888 RepID=A0AAU9K5H0_9CILI|nr:unnamed protein product [Blepharisma stoltei]